MKPESRLKGFFFLFVRIPEEVFSSFTWGLIGVESE